MANRVPVHCIVPLEDGFQVRMTLPIGVQPEEAHRLKSIVDEDTVADHEDLKFPQADPCISPEITL